MPVWKFTENGSSTLESLEDARLDLAVYAQQLEDLRTWFRAHDGVELEDLQAWLSAVALSEEDAGTILEAFYQSLDDAVTSLSAVATGYSDLGSFLYTLALDKNSLSAFLSASGYTLQDFKCYLSTGSSTVYSNIGVFLWASNGLVTDQNIGLCLMAVKEFSSPYAGTYQRVASVVRRLS